MFKIIVIKNGRKVGKINLAQENMTLLDLQVFKEMFGVKLVGKYIRN
jgi:hypothetical protein